MHKINLVILFILTILISCNSVDNSINVIVNDSLDLDLVKIQYGFYSGSEASDKKLVSSGLDKIIFADSQKRAFNTICGENDFLVTYADKYYVKVRHFIPNDFRDGVPDEHEYIFEITREPNGLLLHLKIEGTNGTTITKKFSEIKNAENNRQGKKISE
ncbi:hypothetical protein [Aquimarina brevivitae]|uniref:Lipoprotein n=1 Tax=Aquimarina brevivitae TaxID=323412 RepID=A0A4Q7NUG0_9FLAO|nr:hypothetical protein [Aquimarina brevivitae]RZS90570.1 hypothetical protein EV197_3364 [Aquimarina brevivitae]